MATHILYFIFDRTHGTRWWDDEIAWRCAWLEVKSDPHARYWEVESSELETDTPEQLH